jgi:hypothetical protein
VRLITDENYSLWAYCAFTVAVIAPLTWIRTLERFRLGYVISGIIILTMLVTVITLDSIKIHDQDGEPGPNY